MDADEFFRTEWREVSERIASTLARRGVGVHDREDVLQEAAIRLYRAWHQLDPARPVEAYARTVAYNAWTDVCRRRRPEQPVEHLPELATTDAVEDTCVVRDQLSHVRRAMQRMRPEQRQLLRAVAAEELGAAPVPAVASDALRMARMRARRQLRAALQVASGIAAFLAATVRSLRPRALPATVVSGAFAVGFALLLAPPGPAPVRPLQPAHDGLVAVQRPLPSERTGTVAKPARPPRSAPAPAPARPSRPAPEETPYYWIDAGPTELGIHLEVEVAGRAVEVRDNGEELPLCVAGAPVAVDPLAGVCRKP